MVMYYSHAKASHSAQPSSSKRSKLLPSFNWDICVLCQEGTNEPLQCPLRSTKQSTIGSGYASLAEDLLRFQTIQHMPMDIKLEQLDEGDGIESTLKAHQAKWHKKCRLQFNREAFDERVQRGSITDKQQGASIYICAHTIFSQPSSVYWAYLFLLQWACWFSMQAYIMHQPTTLTAMCGGGVPLNCRIPLCWPSSQQETWLPLRPEEVGHAS